MASGILFPTLSSIPVFIATILHPQDALVTLIVVTETPIAWHDTEAFLEETTVGEEPLGLTVRPCSGLLEEKRQTNWYPIYMEKITR